MWHLLLVLLAQAVGLAQEPTVNGPLAEIRIEGTSVYRNIIGVVISARPGVPAERIDLEAERDRVYGLGTFREVTVDLERGEAGPVLVVRVLENPTIASINFPGAATLAPSQLADLLRRENLLEPGAVFNTTRAQEAVNDIQQAYRTEAGFPFDVDVTLNVGQASAGDDVPVDLNYTIVEDAPIERVEFAPSQVLSEDELTEIFRPFENAGSFDPRGYLFAVDRVAELYREEGFRQSGVDLGATELTNGTLTVRFRELTIASIDTTAIGIPASDLSLGQGDLFNYDVLLGDVRRLAEGRSGDVRLVARTVGDRVRVTFELGPPDTAGPIDRIVIEGNTVIPTAELEELLTLELGDTFTSTLAEEDFQRLRERYGEEGYVVATQSNFNYLDGLYVQRLTELKIGGYQVTFEGERDNTEDFVVTRYFPAPGSVLNLDSLNASLLQVARLRAVQPVGRQFLPGEEADEVIVNVIVRNTQTGVFQPSAGYATDKGFSGSISYSESNFLGRAHNISAELSAQTSDLGLQVGGSARYSIPWIYLDEFDFREVPTSVSGSLFSLVSSNQLLSAGGNARVLFPGAPDNDGNRVLVGEFTSRESGVGFSVGRPIYDFTTLSVSARGTVTNYKLEPTAVECTFDANGNVENADRCALPRESALRYLPQGGLSSFISSTVNYDDRDNPDFPRSGVAARGLVGIGIGTDFRNPDTGRQQSYAYEQVEFGVKTYLLLRDIAGGEIDDPNHVFAVRLNVGHQFGGAYPSARRFRVGNTSNEATQIRGYRLGDFNLSKTYLTSSIEYRYDFGLDTFATQTIIGIVFADLGYASGVPLFDDYQTPLFAGVGLGVQINLGFSGVILPAIRFDYGFSERNPTGVFSFSVGPVF